MITIYAEKFDVGLRIACALTGGLDHKGKKITNENLDSYKDSMSDFRKQGYIPFTVKGRNYAVTWGFGHMFELFAPNDYDKEDRFWNRKLPIIPEKFKIKVAEGYDMKTGKPTYKPDPRTERQLKIVNSLFEKSEFAYLATDDDREGQLIGAYLFEGLMVNLPTRRVRIQSMTRQGIVDAFNTAVDNRQMRGIEDAGRCRAIADWLVGMNLSPANSIRYRQYTPDMKILPTGRVKTAVLAMIVHREEAIRNFKVEPFWYLEAVCTTAKGEKYIAKHSVKQYMKKEDAEDTMKRCASATQGSVVDCKKEPVSKNVPLLYNILALQVDANNIYGYKADEVLSIVQSLYDAGLVTYPRGDSRHLTEDMKPVVDNVLDMLSTLSPLYQNWIMQASPKGGRPYSKRHFDNSKVESHYAIIPTVQKPNIQKLDEKQRNIYDLIARSVMRIAFTSAKCEKTTIVTDINGEKFTVTGTVVKDPQWMTVKQIKAKKEKEEELLPSVTNGETVTAKVQMKEGKTKAPTRYTDASLLLAMQSASKEIDDEKLKKILEEKNEGGIGRPSTRAEIIKQVVKLYCKRKGKTIEPTEDAIRFINVMPVEELKSPEMTAVWEMKLDQIEKGTMCMEQFMKEITDSVVKWTLQVVNDNPSMEKPDASQTKAGTGVKCPCCGGDMMKGKKGYYCSNWKIKGCQFTVWKKMYGANITEKQLKLLIEKGKTDYLNMKSKAGKDYKAKICLKADGTTELEFAPREGGSFG